ncbi:hypothetical protein M9458_013652, partial [Cirrhinus mrigala]
PSSTMASPSIGSTVGHLPGWALEYFLPPSAPPWSSLPPAPSWILFIVLLMVIRPPPEPLP